MAENVTIRINTEAAGNGLQTVARGLSLLKSGVEGFSRVAAGVARVVAGIAAPIAGAVSAGAFVRFAASAISSADAMARSAAQAGMTAREFSGLNYAAQLNRVTQEELTKGSQKLAEFLGKTGQAGRNLSEAFLEQAEIVSKMADGDEKLLYVRRVFGEEGLKLIPVLNLGSEALRRQVEEANQLGVSIGDDFSASVRKYLENIGRIKAATRGLFNRIAETLLPDLERISDDVVEWAKTNSARIRDFVSGSITTVIGSFRQGRFGELFSAVIDVAISEGFNRGITFGTNLIKEGLEKLFSVDFLIFAAQAGRHLAHFLLLGVKVPVDVFVALFEKAIQIIFNAWENGVNKVSDLMATAMTKSFNTIVAALNKLRIFGEFAPLEWKGAGKATQDVRTFGEVFQQIQKQSSEAIQGTLGYFDEQIAKTKALLTLGTTENVELERKISALEKLRALAKEIQEVEAERIIVNTPSDTPTDESGPEEKIGRFQRFIADFEASWVESFHRIEDEFTSVADGIADSMVNGIARAIDTVSFGIWNVIDGTATWGEMFQNVARNMVSDLIRVGLQEIALSTLKKGLAIAWDAFSSALRGKQVIAENAAELAKTPAKAANATLASISSYGVAAAIGIAAVAAILASVGAFQEGGIVQGGRQLIQVNERGREAVLNANATAMLGDDVINRLNAGQFDSLRAESDILLASAAGGGVAGQAPPVNASFLIVDNMYSQAARDYIASNSGQTQILELIRNNRTDIGF